MSVSQKLISDFFKPKQKRFITDYFKYASADHAIKKRKDIAYLPAKDYKLAREFFKKRRYLYDAVATRQGYCFCASANFCEYQVYTVNDRCVKNKNEKVFMPAGSLVASATVDNDSALTHISVETAFRRQGIGKQLIRFINKHDTQFHVYAGVAHNSRYRLTEEGAALIHACQSSGILDDEQVIPSTVPCSPSSVCSSRPHR